MIDPPTRPGAMSREEKDRLKAEMLEQTYITGPQHIGEFSEHQRADMKTMFKEAVNEWLDEKFSTFGRWAFISVMAMIFVGLIFFAATMQGWHLSKSVAEAAEATK